MAAVPVDRVEVVGTQRLGGDVVHVERPPRRTDVERHGGLARRELAQFGDHHLDDEGATRCEVRRDVAEAVDLCLLGRQVHEGVEDQVGDRERPVHPRGREVAEGHADVPATRLGPQPVDHRPRQVDAVHRHAAPRQRQGDPAGPDPQFQGPTATGEPGQHLDGRSHDVRREHLRRRLVVGRRDALPEVAVLVIHGHGPYCGRHPPRTAFSPARRRPSDATTALSAAPPRRAPRRPRPRCRRGRPS